MVIAVCRRLIGREHEANQREQGKGVIQDLRVGRPVPEIIKQLHRVEQHRQHQEKRLRLLPGEVGYRRRGQPSCTDDAEHIQHHAEPARARKGQHTPGRDRQCAQNAQRGIRREFPVYIGIRLPLFQCRRAQQKQQAHQHGKRDHRHGAPTGALRGAEEIARSPGNRRQIRQPK